MSPYTLTIVLITITVYLLIHFGCWQWMQFCSEKKQAIFRKRNLINIDTRIEEIDSPASPCFRLYLLRKYWCLWYHCRLNKYLHKKYFSLKAIYRLTSFRTEALMAYAYIPVVRSHCIDLKRNSIIPTGNVNNANISIFFTINQHY